MFESSTTGGVFPNERKAVGYFRKRVPCVHCCLLAFSIETGHGVAPRECMEEWKCFWNARFQLTGDIMGCNIMKMCTSAKPDPKFNCLVALKLFQLLYKSDSQNKNISINSAQEDLGEATLYCICCMKEHSSIGFFMVARGQSSDVVT